MKTKQKTSKKIHAGPTGTPPKQRLPAQNWLHLYSLPDILQVLLQHLLLLCHHGSCGVVGLAPLLPKKGGNTHVNAGNMRGRIPLSSPHPTPAPLLFGWDASIMREGKLRQQHAGHCNRNSTVATALQVQ